MNSCPANASPLPNSILPLMDSAQVFCRVRPLRVCAEAQMDSVYLAEPVPGGTGPVSLDVLSFLDPVANSTEEQCFSARSRSTVLQGLPFGGVPTVLAINFILWLVREARSGPRQDAISPCPPPPVSATQSLGASSKHLLGKERGRPIRRGGSDSV